MKGQAGQQPHASRAWRLMRCGCGCGAARCGAAAACGVGSAVLRASCAAVVMAACGRRQISTARRRSSSAQSSSLRSVCLSRFDAAHATAPQRCGDYRGIAAALRRQPR
jgi:hypothetical protein